MIPAGVANRRAFLGAVLCIAGTCWVAAQVQAVPQERLGLVESSTPLWPADQEWLVEPEPALVIGNDRGPEPYLLYGVESALLLPQRGVVVSSRGSRDLRYFGVDGEHRRTVGGRGEGPGEFEWPRWMGRIDGGRILAWDGPNSRVHVFSASGELIRTTVIDPIIPPSMSGHAELPGRPLAVGAFPDGSLVVTPAFPTSFLTSRPNGVHRLTMPLVLYSVDGSAEAHLVDVDGEEHVVQERSSMHLPFGHRFFVAVARDRIYVGSGKPYEIRVLDHGGNEVGLVRRSQEPREISAAHRRRYRERLLDRMAPASQSGLGEMLDAIDFPATFPAYDALLVDTEGNLWARDHEWPREGRATWSVFDHAGRWLGTVDIPAGLEVTDISGSRIAGLVEDETGVERVVVHRLIKPGH